MHRKKQKKTRKKNLFAVLQGMFTGAFLALGAVLLSYPWVSDYYSRQEVASSVTAYKETISNTDTKDIEDALAAAQLYNSTIQQSQVYLADPFSSTLVTEDENNDYYKLLDLSGNGIMCYIDIPSIDVYLPVFHGTSDEVLNAGAGHLPGSSLPVGGENTHAVITGHTGLTSAKMFTDLTQLEEGDMFYIHVLGQILAYEITEIQVVQPEDTRSLLIREGEDLVTLVTCTPYGINSHRLFVTGTRVEYSADVYKTESKEAEEKISDSEWMRTYRNAIIIGITAVIVSQIIGSAVRYVLKKKKGKENG